MNAVEFDNDANWFADESIRCLNRWSNDDSKFNKCCSQYCNFSLVELSSSSLRFNSAWRQSTSFYDKNYFIFLKKIIDLTSFNTNSGEFLDISNLVLSNNNSKFLDFSNKLLKFCSWAEIEDFSKNIFKI